jgi:hypothetical protein
VALDPLLDPDFDFGGQQVGEFFLQTAQVPGLFFLGFLRHQVEFGTQLFHQAFGFAHGELACCDLVGCRDLCRFVQRQQGPGVAHVDIAGHQHGLHRLGQIEQAKQVAGRAARAAHRLRCLFMGQSEFLDQALQALRFLQGVEVFPLDVLDQRHRGGGFVGHVAHQYRHPLQPGQAGGTETPLAGNDFVAPGVVAPGQTTNKNGLHDALGTNRLGQFVQGPFVHAGARLVGTRHQIVQRQFTGALRRDVASLRVGVWLDAWAQQGVEAAAEAFGFLGDHGVSSVRQQIGQQGAAIRPVAQPGIGVDMAAGAKMVEGAAPVGRQSAGMGQGTVGVVTAGDQHAGKRQALAGNRAPARNQCGEIGAADFRWRDQQGSAHAVVVAAVRRPPGRQQSSPGCARPAPAAPGVWQHDVLQPHRPVAAQRAHPVVLLHPRGSRKDCFPPGLPVTRATVLPAGQQQHRGRAGVNRDHRRLLGV